MRGELHAAPGPVRQGFRWPPTGTLVGGNPGVPTMLYFALAKRYDPVMPRKALPKDETGSTVSGANKKGKQPVTFTAEPISREDIPAAGKRGGRPANIPAIEAFLNSLTVPGTYEMKSADEDGGHPVNRITQIRKVAGDRFKVETAPLDSGKRYRVFVTKDAETANA